MATTAPALRTAQFGVIGLGNMGENLALNARRDFFGAHTYQRVDFPGAGPVHTDWRRLIDGPSRPSQG